MTSYCEEQYIAALEKRLKEKEAMIDWLADSCGERDCPHGCPFEDALSLEECMDCWRKAAQEAVKKND